MRQVIASQCSIAVFRQSSPAYVQPTLKRVRRGVARSGDTSSLVLVDSPFSTVVGSIQIPVGLSAEGDSALAHSARLVGQAGLAVEANTAFSLVGRLVGPVGLAIEVDTALSLGQGGIAISAGLAVENDLALPLAGRLRRAIGMAVEADSGLGLAGVTRAAVGMAASNETAQELLAKSVGQAGIAIESGQAFGLAGRLRGVVGLANSMEFAEVPTPVPIDDSFELPLPRPQVIRRVSGAVFVASVPKRTTIGRSR